MAVAKKKKKSYTTAAFNKGKIGVDTGETIKGTD